MEIKYGNEYEERTFENLKLSGELFKKYKFTGCRFINCSFEDCELNQCSFSSCVFEKCQIISLKANNDSQIQFTEFVSCQLIGINWEDLLPSVKFANPIKKMTGCILKYNTFSKINFRKFTFSSNEIYDSMFAECQLTESNFTSCKLDKTEFFKCNLQKSDFREANGYQIDIMTCRMANAVFSFPEVINLLNGLGIQID